MTNLPPVVHLATTVSGGAGIALQRSHQALLAAGVSSRILVGHLEGNPSPAIAQCPRQRASLLERIARRGGWILDSSDRLTAALEQTRPAGSDAVGYELFSPPYSRYRPERHAWLKPPALPHLHWVAGFIDWPRFFARVQGPAVITLHDQQNYLGGVHYADDATANPWLAPFEQRVREIKRRALSGRRLAVIGNSEWNTRAAQDSRFFPSGTSFDSIPYALDSTVFSPRPRPEAKRRLGIAPDRLVIGFACDALANRRKGFDVLVQALRALPADLLPLTSLVSFGREPDPALAASVPLEWKHLGFLATDAAKADAYSAMDLFVVPSRAEAFGQTAIEAMACGSAVIASRVGGLAEAVDHGRAGILVPPDEPHLLRDAIEQCLRSSEKRAALASSARSHVVAQHAPEKHAIACLDVYRRLLTRRLDPN
jgi:glycosyltransferase involved in cell wall biosynthesis